MDFKVKRRKHISLFVTILNKQIFSYPDLTAGFI